MWVEEVLPRWHTDQIRKRSKKVQKLIEKGLPQEVRPLAWTEVVGNELALTRAMFEKELKASHDAAPTARVRAGRALIETDLERTFSSMGGLFSDPDSAWKESLRQVLEAFLHYRPELGYVQGMSFLAAVLLMHTDAGGGHADGKADAFPAFCCLANLLRPQPTRVLQTLLRLDGPKMDILFAFWEKQFEESLPALHAHFIDVGVMPQLYLIEWIFTLFAKSLPQEPVAWIWDQVLLLGDQRIFQVALGILKLLESKFLGMAELDEISAVLKDLMGSPTLFEALVSTQAICRCLCFFGAILTRCGVIPARRPGRGGDDQEEGPVERSVREHREDEAASIAVEGLSVQLAQSVCCWPHSWICSDRLLVFFTVLHEVQDFETELKTDGADSELIRLVM